MRITRICLPVAAAALALTMGLLPAGGPPPAAATAITPAGAAADPLCNGVYQFDRDNGANLSLTTRYFTSMPIAWGASATSIRCTLRYNDFQHSVRYLQVALNRCYGSRLGIGKLFDHQTATVVNIVRRKLGLPMSGVYDLVMARRMRWPMADDQTGAASCQRIRFPIAAAPSVGAAAADAVCNMSGRMVFFETEGGSWHMTIPWRHPAAPAGDGLYCYEAAGADNRGVMYLKIALNRCHGYRLSYTWKFDYHTHVAVNAVRKRLGLPQNGRYDADLWTKMAWPKLNDFTGATSC
jgi:hypothetical protein